MSAPLKKNGKLFMIFYNIPEDVICNNSKKLLKKYNEVVKKKYLFCKVLKIRVS